MAVKVAINGFGRIGRLAFRQMFGAEGYEAERGNQVRNLSDPVTVTEEQVSESIVRMHEKER